MSTFKFFALAALMATSLPFTSLVYGAERGGGGVHASAGSHANYGGNYGRDNNATQRYDDQRAYNRGLNQGVDEGYINGGWQDNGGGVWDDNVYPNAGANINQVEQYANPNSALNQNNDYNQNQQYDQMRTTQELNTDSNLLNQQLNKQY